VKAFFDELSSSGVRDFQGYFKNHPKDVIRCASLIKIVDVNAESLKFFQVNSKKEIQENYLSYFIDESWPMFAKELCTLAEGGTEFESEVPFRNSAGERKDFILRLSVSPGHQKNLDRVLVSFLDITERKRAELTIREDEARLRQIIDLVPHFVFAKNRKGQFILVNKAVADAYGTTVDNLMSKTDADFNPNVTEVDHFLFDDNEVMDKGRLKDIPSERITDSKGRVRYLHTIKIPYRTTVSNEDAVLGVSIDITERKLAEKTIKESEEQFRSLAEQSPNMIFINQKGNIVYANKKCAEVMGYRFDEFLSPSFDFRTLIVPESRELIEESFKRHAKGEDVPSYEYSLVTKYGKRIDAIITTKLIKYKNENAILGIVTDITERKHAEDVLRQSEERFRSLVQNSSDVITIHDVTGSIIYATPSMERILGYKTADIIGKNPLEFIHPQDFQMTAKALELVIKKLNPGIPTEFRFKHADGSWIILESVGLNLLDHPDVHGIILTSRDITKRKKTEEEILSSREQLRNLSARLNTIREEESTRIAREIHDELGQVLTGIKMDLSFFEELLSEKPAEVRDHSINSKISSMSDLVDSAIRSIRRIGTELRPAVLDNMGLQAAIEWQAEEFQQRTGIKCECVILDQTFEVDRDRSTAVFRIFQESLTNIARHYKSKNVWVSFGKQGDDLFLEVRDNGKGISENDTHKKDSFGLLGMKERASVFGGRLEVNGVLGRGTTVTLQIPLR
jgi:PAS domain S-box-containing protein